MLRVSRGHRSPHRCTRLWPEVPPIRRQALRRWSAPTPRIGWADGSGRIRFDLNPGGLEEAGQIVLTEISLTYTEAELSGQTATANQEVYYKLVDAQGNGMATRYFDVHRPPVPDRDKGIGWILTLNARTDPA